MLNQFDYWLPDDIKADVESEIKRWTSDRKISRIWDRDPKVWTDSGEEKWLGWLDMPVNESVNTERYQSAHRNFLDTGFTDIVLLGMGGSSLCPEVFAITFEKQNFHILDSTVPAQIIELENRLNLEKTLFIVASKSGSTLEPNSFKQYFFQRVTAVVGKEQAGNHFVAITDPGSKLEAVAKEDGFSAIYYGEPTVGGRFSALTAFGLIPAALMGIDVSEILKPALEMADACRSDNPAQNPGAVLGLLLGACHGRGRNKLTIFTSPEIYDVGAWMEQLVAESTGKNGIAIIPVDREPLLKASEYSGDRVFVFLTLSEDTGYDELIENLKAAGHPCVRITLDGIDTLGGEFYRWEFATAVAGALMGINPFDQPDVEAAKIEAKKLTSSYEETGELPSEEPFLVQGPLSLFGDDELSGLRAETFDSVLDQHLARLGKDDYFALLAYIEMNPKTQDLLQTIRTIVLRKYNVATCLGFGPRFLHSTGQAYKGGPETGVFLQITSDDQADIDVPGQGFTFGVIKSAQSRGDFQVLLDRGRRALRIHIKCGTEDGLTAIIDSLR